jgi:AcrR family transcriptional regulator
MAVKSTSKLPRFASEERRQAVLEAAREVFAESGLAGARTKAIAERAGVAEGLIFKHFKSKEMLFESAVVDAFSDMIERVDAASTAFAQASHGADRETHAREFQKEILDALIKIGPLLGAALVDSGDHQSSFYLRQLAPTIEHIAKAYADVSRGLPGETDPQLLARVTLGTHLLIALDVNYRDIPIDTATVATEFTSLLVNGYQGHRTGT